MIFTTTLTVSAGALASSPAEARLPVARGIIHQVDVAFLDGPEYEVHVAVRAPGAHQIAPTSEGSIVGNNETVPATLRYSFLEPPYEVVVQGWAPDADYAHIIAVRVHVLPPEVLSPERPEVGLLQRISRFLGAGG